MQGQVWLPHDPQLLAVPIPITNETTQHLQQAGSNDASADVAAADGRRRLGPVALIPRNGDVLGGDLAARWTGSAGLFNPWVSYMNAGVMMWRSCPAAIQVGTLLRGGGGRGGGVKGE